MKLVVCEPLSISDALKEEYAEKMKSRGIETTFYDTKAADADELAERVQDADFVISANQPFPDKAVQAMNQAKLLDVAFTGTDHVAKQTLKEKGILLCNAQGYATNAVAELVLGMMLSLVREIPKMDQKTREGHGRENGFGTELRGKTIGIIGAGDIGLATARLAKAFGMQILAFARSEREEAKEIGIDFTDLDTLLRESDFVSIHVPLAENTKGLIGQNELNKMKPTAYLINTARGPVVDTFSLVEALKNGTIQGAALDVFDTEPPLDSENKLLELNQLVLTPHIGYATAESFEDRARIVFENILAYLDGHPINIVKN